MKVFFSPFVSQNSSPSGLGSREIAMCFCSALATVLGSALSIVFAYASIKIMLIVTITITLPLLLYLCGNPRLFFFIGFIIALPLGLSINFQAIEHIGGASSYAFSLADLLLIPLTFFLIRDFTLGYRTQLQFPKVMWWWVALIILSLYWIIRGPYRNLAGYETLRAVQSLWIVLIFIHECRRIRQFEIAAWAIVAGIFLQIIIGYIQFSIESDLGLQALGEAGSASTAGANQGVYGEQSEVYRVGGLLGHPNLLGAYLAAFLPIPMALLFGSFSKHKKFILATVSVLGIMLLLITLSRSGWISFFFAFNLLLFFSFFNPTLRGKYRGLKTSVVVSALALTLLTSGPIAKRLTQSDEGAFNFRIDWMITAIHMVQDKPIMGYGLNTFIYHLPNKTKYGGYQSLNRVFGQLWPVVHNTYLIIWSEQGSLGFLVFIGFHIGIIRTAIQNLRYPLNTHLYLINIGSLCGFLALMIDGIASFFIKVPSTGRSWWILIGLIMAIQQWNQREMSYRSSQK